MKKRTLKTALILLGILFAIRLSVSAKVGEPIGVAYHTDIVAYINNFAIPSYAVTGQSCIVAEDLKNFGFDVIWDDETRSLSIYRNGNTNVNEISFSKEGKSGDFFANILETDIAVYTSNKRLTSFALNGYTMIPMEELTGFGKIEWLPDERALVMNIYGLNSRSEKQYVAEYTEPITEGPVNSYAYVALKNFLIRNGAYSNGYYYIRDHYYDDVEIDYDSKEEYIVFYWFSEDYDLESKIYLFLYENSHPEVSYPIILEDGFKTEFKGIYYSPQITVWKSTFPETNNSSINALNSTYRYFDFILKLKGADLKISDFNIAY